MQELVYEIEQTLQNLKKSISGRYSVAKERAKAEYEYRTALGREMAMAKAEGMAATALYEFCRGLEVVATYAVSGIYSLLRKTTSPSLSSTIGQSCVC